MSLTKVKAGNILLTTPGASSNDVTPATTQYVTTAISNLVDTAPSTLNTLNELAAALGDDVNFSTTVTNSIATKLPLAGGTLTGNLSIGTSNPGTYQLAVDSGTAGTSNALAGIFVEGQRNGVVYNLVSNNTSNGTDKGSGIQFRSGGFLSSGIIGRSDAVAASGDAPGYLTFHTSTDGFEDFLERMRIDSSGNVGIGASSPGVKLEIGENSSSTNVGYIRLRGHNTLEGNIYKDATYGLHFDTNSNNQPIRIDGSKQILGITGNVGIGTESPGVTLDISTSTANTNGVVRIQNNMDNDYEALRLHSLGNHDAQMSFLAQGDSTYWGAFGIDYSDAGKFKLQTDNLFVGGSNLMTWARDGNVGIGTTGPLVSLDVEAGSGGGIRLKPSGQITNGYTGGVADFRRGLTFENAGSAHAFSIGYGQGGHLRVSYHDGASTFTELAEFKNSGDLNLSAGNLEIQSGYGINFNANANASGMTSELLDDYEEGTWTPDLRNGTTSLTTQTWLYGPQATYTKVGDLVFIHLAGKLSSVGGTGTSEFRVFGLPFQPQYSGGYQEYRMNFILGSSVNASDSASCFAFVRNGGNDFGCRILDGGDTVFTSNRIDNDTFFSIYGCYKT